MDEKHMSRDLARAVVIEKIATGICQRDIGDSITSLTGAIVIVARRSREAAQMLQITIPIQALQTTLAMLSSPEQRSSTLLEMARCSVPVDCPSCSAPVFVAGDSDRDLVRCPDLACGIALITARGIDGLPILRRMDPQPDSDPCLA